MYTSKIDTFIKTYKKPKIFDNNTLRSETVPQKKRGHHNHEQIRELFYFPKRH